MKAKDDEFRKYLKTLEDDLGAKAADAATKLQGEVVNFYKQSGYDDAKSIVSGQNTDFLHEKEFSLENLKTVIDGISAAVFAGAATPKGATPNGDAAAAAAKKLGTAVGALANMELYIAGKVFDVLSSTVLSFGAGSTMSYTTATKNEPLGYGMQLFTSVSASSYQSHSFFANESIFQYLYMYEVRWSAKQTDSEEEMLIQMALENELAVYVTKLNDYAEQCSEGAIAESTFDAVATQFHKQIKDFRAEINSLKSAETAAHVRAALDKAHARSQ
ncbi:hypothetical protein OG244_38610 [Streptomyces brevispora]|uniref:hypothetical protein n=1 Tax=Streptomyces brevispora TaxID=887462 RepID=UPI002E323533|nr:hypothetical protein [Streptomyces brevispora]